MVARGESQYAVVCCFVLPHHYTNWLKMEED